MDKQGMAGPLRRVMALFARGRQGVAEIASRAARPSAEARHAAWNTKVLGSAFARQLYASGAAGPGVRPQSFPVQVRLTSGLCRQADIEQPWLHY